MVIEPSVGIEVFMFGDRLSRDLAGVFGDIREIGFESVEITDEVVSFGSKNVKKLLDNANLKCSGVHTDFENIRDRDILNRYFKILDELDTSNLICSGIGGGESVQDYTEASRLFDDVAKLCAQHNKIFYYHTHEYDFVPLEDKGKGIDIIGTITNPEFVKFVTDIYWVDLGSESLIEFVNSYSKRTGYYHFKDGFPGKFTELGAGKVDIPSLIETAKKFGLTWVIYEQDICQRPVLESAKISRDYLKKLGL